MILHSMGGTMKNILLLAFVLVLGSLGCNETANPERSGEPETLEEARSTQGLATCDSDGEDPRCIDFKACDEQCQSDCEAAGYEGGCCQDHFLCGGDDLMCRCYMALGVAGAAQ
jgi:hypothetical protein